MADSTSKEFHAFDSMMDRLLTVPKATINKRVAEHRKRAALNPNKPGPKTGTRRKKRR